MENQKFKPTIRTLANKALSSLLLLPGIFFAIRFLLMTGIHIGIMIPLFFFCILWAIYLFNLLLYPFLTELAISDTGITYSQPFFSVFCDWGSITEVIYTTKHLELIYNQNARVKDIFIVKNIIPQKKYTTSLFRKRVYSKEELDL